MDVVKYREWLYHALWIGELTPQMRAEMEKTRIERVKANMGKGQAPQAALDELLRRRDEAIARAKAQVE